MHQGHHPRALRQSRTSCGSSSRSMHIEFPNPQLLGSNRSPFPPPTIGGHQKPGQLPQIEEEMQLSPIPPTSQLLPASTWKFHLRRAIVAPHNLQLAVDDEGGRVRNVTMDGGWIWAMAGGGLGTGSRQSNFGGTTRGGGGWPVRRPNKA